MSGTMGRSRPAAGFVAPGALLVVVASVAWLAVGRAGSPGTGDAVAVRRGEMAIGTDVSGILSAVDTAQLGPPQIEEVWQFKLTSMAPEGALVKRGDPVLSFDTSELQNLLRDKTAERDTAQKQLEQKQNDLDIARRDDELQLAEAEGRLRRASLKADIPPDLEPTVARKDLLEARTDLALARREIAYVKERNAAHVRVAKAEIASLMSRRDAAAGRVSQTLARLGQMTVRAPRDGTVVYIAGPGGEKKKVGDSAWRVEKILEIPDLRRMRAEGELDEVDAGKVVPGQAVSLRLDAHPEILYHGRVRSISNAVKTRSAEDLRKVVSLVIDLSRTDPLRMRPGMRFVGTVELARLPSVLMLPLSAVFNRPYGPVVYRQARWGPAQVRPRLGRRNSQEVEVLGGLAEGDRVLARDPNAAYTAEDTVGGQGAEGKAAQAAPLAAGGAPR